MKLILDLLERELVRLESELQRARASFDQTAQANVALGKEVESLRRKADQADQARAISREWERQVTETTKEMLRLRAELDESKKRRRRRR